MIQVKICGITRVEDALASVDAGADMIGFNFYNASPRYLSPAACMQIQDALNKRNTDIVTVAVFVNAKAETIRSIMKQCGIDYAQLSGDEDPELTAALQPIAFKAIRPKTLAETKNQSLLYANQHLKPNLLLDAHHPALYGGTGLKTDTAIAANLVKDYDILLAGGLNPENITNVVTSVSPWGVDVASGVESSPGIKDHKKIAAFTQRAKRLS